MTGPNRDMRVSDNERQSAADRLRIAQNEGRITVSEYDDRLGRLYQAITYGEVADLLADLPSPAPPPVMHQPYVPPMPPPQPIAGNIAGPAAIVQNTIVVPTPAFLPNSGWATAGLVFGILGLVGFWVPFGDIAFSLFAVLLSAIGLAQTGNGKMGGRGRAIGGLICGIIGLIPAIIVVALLFTAAATIH